jgi:uncharacterized protein (DUF1501 family)
MSRSWTRRDFLKATSAAALGALFTGEPKLVCAADDKIKPRADSVIFLWLAGGLAHTDSFDPKKHTPFHRGSYERNILSTFPSIDTALDGVKFSAGLEHLAAVMDRGTILRSIVEPDLGHILHSRHQYFWHTGYAPSPAVAYPNIGSVVAKLRGTENADLPGFVHIGQRLDLAGNAEVKAFLTGGYLGAEFGPLNIPNAGQATELVHLPNGMNHLRFENRFALYKKIVAGHEASAYASDFQRESLLRSMEGAYRLIRSPSAKAFNLDLEPREKLERYKLGGKFGLGCLLARRLIEEGVCFVEVSSEFIPFGNFDTHERGHFRMKELKQWIDVPIAQLVLDLEERGLLNRTIVVVASEFSRASFKTNSKNVAAPTKNRVLQAQQYGLHHHFTGANCALFFGGGFKRGYVHGSTDDEAPCRAATDIVETTNVLATLYAALGISPDTSFEVEKRPIYLTENGEGKAVEGLFA